MPPSVVDSGGSSTSACSMSARTSGHRSRALSSSASSTERRPASFALSFGNRASVEARQPRSFGLARPVASAGGESRQIVTAFELLAELAAQGTASVVSSSTASSRRLISARVDQRIRQPLRQQPGAHRRDGLIHHPQERALRDAPRGSCESVPGWLAGRLVDDQVRAAAVRLQPGDVPESADFCVSCTYSSSAPAATTPGESASRSKPSSVAAWKVRQQPPPALVAGERPRWALGDQQVEGRGLRVEGRQVLCASCFVSSARTSPVRCSMLDVRCSMFAFRPSSFLRPPSSNPRPFRHEAFRRTQAGQLIG